MPLRYVLIRTSFISITTFRLLGQIPDESVDVHPPMRDVRFNGDAARTAHGRPRSRSSAGGERTDRFFVISHERNA
jgi:hypothetical protein